MTKRILKILNFEWNFIAIEKEKNQSIKIRNWTSLTIHTGQLARPLPPAQRTSRIGGLI
jgi:hypothetical protein